MSGILLKYEDRAFWSKYLVDIWSYHLAHLLLQTPDAPENLVKYSNELMEYAKQGLPDYMFDFIDAYENDIDLLLELSQKTLSRFDNYDAFLEDEAKRLQCRIEDFRQKPEVFIHSNNTYIDIVGYLTFSDLPRLRIFSELVIKILTGNGWHKAYFNTYADPYRVGMIDYLESIKPDGQVLLGNIPNIRIHGFIHWVSAENTDCEIDWSTYNSICHGVPDLVVFTSCDIGVDTDEDLIFLEEDVQARGLYEKWELDHKLQLTRVLSTIGEPSHKRYRADEDFYSEALGKTVNLGFLYQIGKT